MSLKRPRQRGTGARGDSSTYDGWVTMEDFSTALPLEERTADNLAYLKSLV
jgi:hypothetical protein